MPLPSTLVDPTARPAWGASVDRSHALATNLDFLLFNEGQGKFAHNLAAPTFPGNAGGTVPTWGPTPEGVGGRVQSGASFEISNHGNIVAGDFTIRVRFVPWSWPGSFTTLFEKSISTNREAGVWFNTSGGLSWAAFGTAGNGISSTRTFPVGQVADLVIARTGGAVRFYFNGILAATGTHVNFLGTTGQNAALTLGRNIGGDQSPNATYLLFQVDNTRAWTAEEAFAASRAPYAFVLPPQTRRFYSVGAGGGTDGSLTAAVATASALAYGATLSGGAALSGGLATASAQGLGATLAGAAQLLAALALADAQSFGGALTGGAALSAALSTADALGYGATFSGGAALLAGLGAAAAQAFDASLSSLGALTLFLARTPDPTVKPEWGALLNRAHPLARGLQGYWLLNEGMGGIVRDLAGNNHGAMSGATWGPTEWGVGLICDPVNSPTVDLGADASLVIGAGSGAWGVWVKGVQGAGAQNLPMASRSTFTSAGYDVVVGAGGVERSVQVRLGIGTNQYNVAGVLVSAGWHLVIGSLDRSTGVLSMYIDGRLRGTVTSVPGTSVGNSQNPSFGKRATTYFNGPIGGGFFYGRAISEEEAFQLYTRPYALLMPPAVPRFSTAGAGESGTLLAALGGASALAQNANLAGGASLQSALMQASALAYGVSLSGAASATFTAVLATATAQLFAASFQGGAGFEGDVATATGLVYDAVMQAGAGGQIAAVLATAQAEGLNAALLGAAQLSAAVMAATALSYPAQFRGQSALTSILHLFTVAAFGDRLTRAARGDDFRKGGGKA